MEYGWRTDAGGFASMRTKRMPTQLAGSGWPIRGGVGEGRLVLVDLPDGRRDEHGGDDAVVPPGMRTEGGWRCLRLAGTLEFGMVGVLASLIGPLAASGISVFVVSTFDTDFLLVKERDFGRTAEVLQLAGHSIAAQSF
jgi:ACT domain